VTPGSRIFISVVTTMTVRDHSAITRLEAENAALEEA